MDVCMIICICTVCTQSVHSSQVPGTHACHVPYRYTMFFLFFYIRLEIRGQGRQILENQPFLDPVCGDCFCRSKSRSSQNPNERHATSTYASRPTATRRPRRNLRSGDDERHESNARNHPHQDTSTEQMAHSPKQNAFCNNSGQPRRRGNCNHS